MEEAFTLQDFLPVSYANPDEGEYIAFLWDAFQSNYEGEKYQFAFLAYHMLIMSFVYFNVWQIKLAIPDTFHKALIGFAREEKNLMKAESPFWFHEVQERTLMRFMRLIECDNSKIGTYAKLVDDRNNSAHPDGHIYFKSQGVLDTKIREVLRIATEIQNHSRPIVEECYRKFLKESQDPEKMYLDAEDQVREVLVHQFYFSQSDIEMCFGFDIDCLAVEPGFERIQELHQVLNSLFGAEVN